MKKKEVSKVKVYSYHELCMNSYGVQNMLIVQHNFPKYFYEGDYINSYYSDRFSSEDWENALQHISHELHIDEWVELEADEDLLDELLHFASALFKRDVTGVRIVRYTNASSGYPVWRIDVFSKGSDTLNEYDYQPNYEIQWGVNKHGEIEYWF
ncbi:hypothetical protein ACFVS2_25890 [Brevibacillus sp. NPDC058079]|uniref:hypothetical protein n=1 Tax=Brevibacillus sp. NPDC058079 TaxID=3346330 RepID=UPI0036EB596E